MEAQSEGASGGPQEVEVDELVMVGECPLGTVPDQDHRRTGQAPHGRYSSHNDHSAEGGSLTTGR